MLAADPLLGESFHLGGSAGLALEPLTFRETCGPWEVVWGWFSPSTQCYLPSQGLTGWGAHPKSFLATSFSATLGHVLNFAERLHFPKSDFSKEQTNLNRFHFAHSRPSSADSVAGGQGVTSGHQPGGTRDVPRLRSERLWCFFFWALNCFRLPFCFFGFVAFPF